MGALEDLSKAIKEFDNKLAIESANRVIEEGIDPIKAFEVMTETIRQIGDSFGREEIWLPELIGAGYAMSSAIPILEEAAKKMGTHKKSLNVAVVGTVYGDIHTTGKMMLATLLTAEGFTVHDLGVNVKAEQFVEAVKQYNSDILCLSSLMTTTAPEQKTVIEALKKVGIRNKVLVMVGGGAITQKFADSIGADGYHPTAHGGAKLARNLIGNNQ